ncbi:MAG: LytTR family transcriptional regulator, partial [Clostridia bacterium]|nr:LytTR family transcriptional regulator [Clostridia bacterium]
DEVSCLTVVDGKTYAIDDKGNQYLVKMRLYEVEQLLPNYFVRINKSAIANQGQIAKFRATFSGAVDVLFKCGHVDYVSRRCFSEIKRRYQL